MNIIELRRKLNEKKFELDEIQNEIYKVETELANEVFEILKDLFPYMKVIGLDGYQNFLFSTSKQLEICNKHPSERYLSDLLGIFICFHYEYDKKHYVDEALKRIEKKIIDKEG
ncbi:Uncharacterised protein [Campylobacter hyointestinalis subsp. hyointestinalis]|uniref:Uncharacterized protein n=1 Tax=Campylobacter hyointestinalis subsp. hyointestinalis TaxID=91352 RepID=A0A0S4SVQ3_CAMHY|nr:hypothetical protein [Campylobacter hyointestinalis]CUU89866.1 Uncharacterised protein [Campylobacter hyointestinalis subsp. hyointestinalis]